MIEYQTYIKIHSWDFAKEYMSCFHSMIFIIYDYFISHNYFFINLQSVIQLAYNDYVPERLFL